MSLCAVHVREFTYSSCRLENDIWIKTAESIFRSTLQSNNRGSAEDDSRGPEQFSGRRISFRFFTFDVFVRVLI